MCRNLIYANPFSSGLLDYKLIQFACVSTKELPMCYERIVHNLEIYNAKNIPYE